MYKASEEATKENDDESSTALQLEKIEIVNSKVVYDDQSTAIHLDLFDFNYTGKGDLSSDLFDLYSNINISKMNFIYENEPYLMNKKVEKYGVAAVERPKIQATKQLDLSGDTGRQIVKSETKLALRTHSKTFKRLADM